jgi:hypothetical protein
VKRTDRLGYVNALLGTPPPPTLLLNPGLTQTRALSEETSCKFRILALQASLRTLQSSLATTTPLAQSTLTLLAQSECLTLTSLLLQKLPRELRDMIYAHLSTRHAEQIEREYFRTTLDPLTRLYSYDFERWKTQHFPEHFWDLSYVPAPFYRELVENYYRTSTFLFPSDSGVMKRFLGTDELRIGVLPKELVSNVEIRINAVSHDRSSYQNYIFGSPQPPGNIKEALDGVWELKAGARVLVRYVTQTDAKGKGEEEEREERDGQCGVVMKKLFGAEQVQKMREGGLKVRFQVDGGYVHDVEEGCALM